MRFCPFDDLIDAESLWRERRDVPRDLRIMGVKKARPGDLSIAGPQKTGTHLLSPGWTTIGPEVFTSEFGMGSGVSPQAKAPA